MQNLPVEMKIQLSEAMSEKLAKRALREHTSVGAIIREALGQYLDARTVSERQSAPRRSVSENFAPEEEVQQRASASALLDLDDVKGRFAGAVNRASNWEELEERLREEGLAISPKGGGLIVRQVDTELELCKASEIGFAYSRLIKRFRTGWSDHPHVWLADRILAQN